MQYTATTSDGATVSFAVETLPQAFASIPDPRRTQGRRYSVAAIVSLAVVAVLANHTSVLAMAGDRCSLSSSWIIPYPAS